MLYDIKNIWLRRSLMILLVIPFLIMTFFIGAMIGALEYTRDFVGDCVSIWKRKF